MFAPVELMIPVEAASDGEVEAFRSSQDAPEDAPPHPTLNERYTFDRFVVGNNNQLAAAACRGRSALPFI